MKQRQLRSHQPQESLFTVAEFSIRIGMSESWTRKTIRSGRITVIRLGRSVRVPESELSRLRLAGMVTAIGSL